MAPSASLETLKRSPPPARTLDTLITSTQSLDLDAPSSSSSSSSPTTPTPTTPVRSASNVTSSTGAVSVPNQLTPPPLFPRAATVSGPTAGGGGGLNRQRPGVGVRAGVGGGLRGQQQAGGMKIPPSLQAKMAALASRSSSSASANSNISASSAQHNPSNSNASSSSSSPSPSPPSVSSHPLPALPLVPRPLPSSNTSTSSEGRARKRPGLTLSAMNSGGSSAASSFNGRKGDAEGEMDGRVAGYGGGVGALVGSALMGNDGTGTPFSNFRKIVDPSGRLNFASKAVLHASGVDFSSGASFSIKMADFELFEELGKGNYGTVQKVWHKPTKVTMALKEIRLELDDSKLKTIITELDILHRATSPYIIDFYGAFFIESCVYYCMEYMDAGSLEKVAGYEVPEDVLARVTRSMVEGLKFLKDELKIMHRDVKPTNVLIDRKGYVKLCDFGVSGQLDRSIAKTNIGCQSYMAPERIKGESLGSSTSYTASSDVWSLGLSIIEFAIGHYPYPPETYSNVFAQLTAIVHGDPPVLPGRKEGAGGEVEEQGVKGYSRTAQEFVEACLRKIANRRPSYAMLLEHPFLKQDVGRDVDMVGWIARAVEHRVQNPRASTPALA